MVFSSSVPTYLDPSNWPQHHQQTVSIETLQLPPPLSVPHGGGDGGGDGGGGGGAGSARPSSMVERALAAKINPQPETALKCPRCESTNTKFCYFNNYSLSQPRHFCKTCRRYWTRGGALRNVPVGGGCRRNKRSKGRSTRTSRSAGSPTKAVGPCSTNGFASNSFNVDDSTGHQMASQLPLQAPILPPLQSLGDFNSTSITINSMVNGGGIGFPVGNTSSLSGGGGGLGSILSSGLVEQWKMQQFPNFLTNIELPSVGLMYRFDDHQGEGVVVHQSKNYIGQPRSNKPLDAGASQVDAIKMEEGQGLNVARNFPSASNVNISDQQWGANTWSGNNNIAGFNSNSAGNFL